MYQVCVNRRFTSQHFLEGGDFGAEGTLHTHHYRVEVILEGHDLDQHGFLVDIVAIEQALAGQIERFGGANLNELPEFGDLNPSVENFARILCMALAHEVPAPPVTRMRVRLWEHDRAWAAYQLDL